MRHCLLLAAALLAGATPPAHAAVLRPFTRTDAATVRLADLFDDLGATPDRVLGAAPAPGARIVVAAAQLAAIARDYNVDWRPQNGSERAVVQRGGVVLAPARVAAALRAALQAQGAPDDFDIAAPDTAPVILPPGSAAEPVVSGLSYDPQAGHFTALVSVDLPNSDSVHIRVSGQVVAMATATVAGTRLGVGRTLAAGDLRTTRVRAALLHGAAPVAPQEAAGMLVRHEVAAGQVLSAADLTRPALVQRGAQVRMVLDADGLSLSAQGIAAEAGARGDRIRVENPLSHMIVLAEVTGSGQVRVAPRPAAIALVSAP